MLFLLAHAVPPMAPISKRKAMMMNSQIAERDAAHANIRTGADAIWWIMVTITTVGYGDRYPVTLAGRLIGMAVMIAGVGAFGAFSGFLANFFLSPKLPTNIGRDAVQNDGGRRR
jgi:voltage-gated potassium channel Kch